MKLRLGLIGIAVLLSLSGCAGSPPNGVNFGPKTIKPGPVSASCDSSGRQAVVDNQVIYDKENAVWDELNADGDFTTEDNAQYAAVVAENDLAYINVLAPTFEACSTASEWIAVAQKYPSFAGYTDGAAVSDDTLQVFCREFLDSPVCVDAASQGLEMLPPPAQKE